MEAAPELIRELNTSLVEDIAEQLFYTSHGFKFWNYQTPGVQEIYRAWAVVIIMLP